MIFSMKKIINSFLLIFLFSGLSCQNNMEPGAETDPNGSSPSAKDQNWSEIANDVSLTLLDKFWHPSGNYFTETNFHPNFNYWPQAHALDVLVDAYIRTEDQRYKDYMDDWFQGVRRENGNTFLNEFYDDMAWNALAMLRVNDHTGDEKFLEEAKKIWEDIKKGWNDTMGGGIAWRKSMPYYKNTPINAPATILAVRLYRKFDNPEDLEWGKKIYRWLYETLYNKETGWVYDGINSENDGKRNETWKFTYNQGTFIGASLELYQVTKEKDYRDNALKAADYTLSDNTLTNFSDNLLRDEHGGDGGLFKGVFVRYFTGLILSDIPDQSDRDRYVRYLKHNAEILWTEGTDKNMLLFGSYWKNKPGSETDLTIQLSGTMLMEAMARIEKSGLEL